MYRKRLMGLLAGGLGLAVATVAFARDKAPEVGLSLHASVSTVAPGEPFEVALKFAIPEGFHLYWENPGESGMAPVVSWRLPAGFEVSGLRFPIPQRFETGGIITYILENSPALLATVTPPKDLKPGTKVTLEADVRWLVCKESCFMQSRTVRIELPTAQEAKPAGDDEALLFRIAHRKLPVAVGKYAEVRVKATADRIAHGDRFELVFDVKIKPGYHVQSNQPLSEFFVPTAVFIKAVPGLRFDEPIWPKAHVRTDPNLGKIAEFAGALQVRVPGRVEAPTIGAKVLVSGLFKYQACDAKGRCHPAEAVEWSVPLTSAFVRAGSASPSPQRPVPPAAAGTQSTDEVKPGSDSRQVIDRDEPARDEGFSYEVYGAEEGGLGQYLKKLGLLGAIIGGLLGGLILNIMPCVLPVISIKILSFVQQAHEKPRRVFHLGLTFSAGIIVSFWLLAGGILLLQHFTGATRGWGAFFQEPKFVVSMIVIMFVFALNLFGVFEIMLPGASAGKLAGVAEGEGFTGAFMKGVLATLLATPCTAPFLAPAISFALAGGPLSVFTIFTSAGVGMAFPYALLTARPAWMKYLPKPGNWMIAFKQLMGFLLIGTVVWLLWVLGELAGVDGVVWMVAALAFLGLACWLFGKVEFGWKTPRKLLAYAGVLGIALVGGRFSYGMSRDVPEIDWIAYEPGLARKLAAEGHTVYVDYTAAWCLTCQLNKKVAFGSKRVRAKMDAFNVIPMEADYTNYDESIGEDLKRFDRDAVPLNVIYPAGKPRHPLVLPVLLVPSTVVGALEKAGPSIEKAGPSTAAESTPQSHAPGGH